MRILQVTDNFRPAVGGLERVVEGLSAELVARGHQVAVATLSRPDAPQREDSAGIAIHRLTGYSSALSRVGDGAEHQFHPTTVDPKLLTALRELVDGFSPDVIHAHGWIANTCMSLDGSVPLVVSLHDYSLRCPTKTMVHRDRFDERCAGDGLRSCLPCARSGYGSVRGIPLALGLMERRRRYGAVSMFLPISRCVAEASFPRGSAEQVRVIPSFVGGEVMRPADDDVPDWVPDGPYVLFVGALGEHKGVGVLHQAWQQMAHHVPLVYLGTPRDDTPDLTAPKGREVLVRSGVAHRQIMNIMSRAAVVAVPSRWPEPLGLVAIEAMCRGRPVVATDIGALPELVKDGETGLLVPPGDVGALSEALDRLLDDQALAQRLGKQARLHGSAYTAAAVVPQVIEVYTDLTTNVRQIHNIL